MQLAVKMPNDMKNNNTNYGCEKEETTVAPTPVIMANKY